MDKLSQAQNPKVELVTVISGLLPQTDERNLLGERLGKVELSQT